MPTQTENMCYLSSLIMGTLSVQTPHNCVCKQKIFVQVTLVFGKDQDHYIKADISLMVVYADHYLISRYRCEVKCMCKPTENQ